MQNRKRVLSLFAHVVTHQSVIERVAELGERGEGGYVCFLTAHMVMESYDKPEFGAKVNNADLIIPDGMPVVWLQKIQDAKEATRVRANDLMIMLFAFAEQRNLKIGFYGGRHEVLTAMVNRAKEEYPNLQIAYAYSPPFRPLTAEEDQKITREINESGTQFLFLGLGCPKQENWMAEHKGKLKAVMLGVGASFDFYAGNVKESPPWIGRLGLEWLFRLTQEPKRLWRRYLILNPRFIWLAILQLFRLKKFRGFTNCNFLST